MRKEYKYFDFIMVLFVAVLLISMLVMAAPVSAGTLEYSTVTTPSGANNQILVSDASFIRVASDGTIFAVDTTPAATDVVYKSVDGGVSWTASAALTIDVADMELSPSYATDGRLFVLNYTDDTARWNCDETAPCLGVSWIRGTYVLASDISPVGVGSHLHL